MIVIQVLHLASDLGGSLRPEGPHDQETDCLHVPHHLHVFMALKTLVTCECVVPL